MRDRALLLPPRQRIDERTDGAPLHAGINQLAGHESFWVGGRRCGRKSVHERHNVASRRADVDCQTGAHRHVSPREHRQGVPVRRGGQERLLECDLRSNERPVVEVDPHVTAVGGRDERLNNGLHALGFRRKAVGQLAAHRRGEVIGLRAPAISVRRASANCRGFFHSGNTDEMANPLPSATLIFAPPMSRAIQVMGGEGLVVHRRTGFLAGLIFDGLGRPSHGSIHLLVLRTVPSASNSSGRSENDKRGGLPEATANMASARFSTASARRPT